MRTNRVIVFFYDKQGRILLHPPVYNNNIYHAHEIDNIIKEKDTAFTTASKIAASYMGSGYEKGASILTGIGNYIFEYDMGDGSSVYYYSIESDDSMKETLSAETMKKFGLGNLFFTCSEISNFMDKNILSKDLTKMFELYTKYKSTIPITMSYRGNDLETFESIFVNHVDNIFKLSKSFCKAYLFLGTEDNNVTRNKVGNILSEKYGLYYSCCRLDDMMVDKQKQEDCFKSMCGVIINLTDHITDFESYLILEKNIRKKFKFVSDILVFRFDNKYLLNKIVRNSPSINRYDRNFTSETALDILEKDKDSKTYPLIEIDTKRSNLGKIKEQIVKYLYDESNNNVTNNNDTNDSDFNHVDISSNPRARLTVTLTCKNLQMTEGIIDMFHFMNGFDINSKHKIKHMNTMVFCMQALTHFRDYHEKILHINYVDKYSTVHNILDTLHSAILENKIPVMTSSKDSEEVVYSFDIYLGTADSMYLYAFMKFLKDNIRTLNDNFSSSTGVTIEIKQKLYVEKHDDYYRSMIPTNSKKIVKIDIPTDIYLCVPIISADETDYELQSYSCSISDYDSHISKYYNICVDNLKENIYSNLDGAIGYETDMDAFRLENYEDNNEINHPNFENIYKFSYSCACGREVNDSELMSLIIGYLNEKYFLNFSKVSITYSYDKKGDNNITMRNITLYEYFKGEYSDCLKTFTKNNMLLKRCLPSLCINYILKNVVIDTMGTDSFDINKYEENFNMISKLKYKFTGKIQTIYDVYVFN